MKDIDEELESLRIEESLKDMIPFVEFDFPTIKGFLQVSTNFKVPNE